MAKSSSTEFLLSSDDLRHLLSGSYESRIHRVELLVSENSEKLFGQKTDALVLGTFNGYAIALSDGGHLVRLRYEEKNGRLNLAEHETLPVPRVRHTDLGDLVHQDARKLVDLMVTGRMDEGKEILSRVARTVGTYPKTQEQLVEAVISAFRHEERQWRRVFKEHYARIRRFLWGELTQIEDRRFRPRFQNLYNGSTPDSELGEHRDSVTSALNDVVSRLGEFSKFVESSVTSFGEQEPEFRDLGEDSLYQTLSSFSSDLLDDIQRVRGSVEEMMDSVTCVACLAKMYDSVSEELYNFELASRFVNRIATRIRDSEEGGRR